MKLALLIFTLFITGIASGQVITTIAGGVTGHGVYWGDGGPATDAAIGGPTGGVFDKNNNYYFSIRGAHRVRKVSPDGTITTVAGNGIAGYNGDGILATNAQLNNPLDVGVDISGNLIITDMMNNRIRKVDHISGVISTIAGNGVSGFSGDGGPATNATLNLPHYVCIDNVDNFYISDKDNQRVRKISPTGIISTVAGNGTRGYSSDGGFADTSMLHNPLGLATDSFGNLYIADKDNFRIRKVTLSTGRISTFAGNGVGSYTGDSIAATASSIAPNDIAFDALGNLYCSDYNQRIRKVDIFRYIYTVAGNGISGYSGDGGTATLAQISQPEGIAVDVCGNLYIADKSNNRIRKVTYPPMLTTPDIALTGAPSVPVGSAATVTATVTNAGSSYLIHWMNHGIEFTTTTVPGVTYTKPPGTDTITARVVPTGYGCWDSATSAAHIVSVDALHSPTPAGASLRIYPNPAGNILYIDALQEEGSYTITTIVGAVAKAGAVQRGGNSVSLVGMAPGIYLLQVLQQNGAKAVYKIVKE